MDHRPLLAPDIVPPRSALPLLLSIPHSGRAYPGWLVRDSVGGLASLTALEDPLIDRLAWRAFALGTGAIIARAPRAAIDCNRAPDEIDPSVVAGSPEPASARAKAGLGIVPGRTASSGHLWRRPITRAELDRRIAIAHAPYHQAIEHGLDRLAITHGGAILLDCHSMPPRHGQAELVIGDRHGTSAGRAVTDAAARIARAAGWSVELNQPYAGGHVIQRHGDPAANIHALQLEFDRRAYLAADGRTPGPGFDRAARLLEALTSGLAGQIELPALAAE
ncbi:MAG: N-formylglutamate amidohydrolase [Pseudomonadota bacterium]